MILWKDIKDENTNTEVNKYSNIERNKFENKIKKKSFFFVFFFFFFFFKNSCYPLKYL